MMLAPITATTYNDSGDQLSKENDNGNIFIIPVIIFSRLAYLFPTSEIHVLLMHLFLDQ